MRGLYLLADRLCVGLLFVLFVCGGCENFQQEEQELIYVTATVLNLRDKPTTKSNVVGRLKRGQELVVVEKGDPWLQVRVDDKTVGWVHGNYVGDPAAVRAMLQKELAQRSSTSKPRVRQRQQQTTRKKVTSAMSIDDMLEGLPEDIPLENMGLLEGKPRHMG
ncbi:MAG: SH3 domain-containing protein, partial [Candidatus Latescibacteria bacterium]|nr:SH3 domain-containing protein [Candidatus Latescibacterota bacterium]